MRKLATILIATSLVGCSETLGSLDMFSDQLPLAEQPLSSLPTARRVAFIDQSLVVVPPRSRVGETVEVSVPVASGGCGNSDTTVVSVSDFTATIVPYQRVLTAPDIVCPAIYFVDRRVVRIKFLQHGAARVRLVSRSGPDQRLLVIESRVEVE